MKLLLIGTVATSFYGFRKDLILQLIAEKHTVYAFFSEGSYDDSLKISELGAIPISYDLQRGGVNPLHDIKQTLKLAKKIKEINPDIVFSYFSKPVIFGTIAAKIARVPRIIGMLEGLGFSFTEQPNGPSIKAEAIKYIQVLLYKASLPQLDELIFLNHDDPKDLIHKYSIDINNIHILGGIGLNLVNYPYTPTPCYKDSINFLFIGRLLREKGIHEFISAAKIVKKHRPNTKFTILGSLDKSNPGSLKQVDLELLTASGIISYPGFVENITEWIADSHVFVLPSYREGFPRSTQEAMAMGRPVITTNAPGCRETVEDGVNGFLVKRWNPNELAEKMIYFVDNPQHIEKMGLESYKIAHDKFDATNVNKKLIKILGL